MGRLLLWARRVTRWLDDWLTRRYNARQDAARVVYLQWLVDHGQLCSQERPGSFCSPLSHDARCYYARHPGGMLPQRRTDGTP